MGSIQNTRTGRLYQLRSEHLIGRSERCDLRLGQPVPSLVAMIRWELHEGWQLLPLRASSIVLEGQAQALQWANLTVGARLDFGGQDRWRFVDDTPPLCFARTVDSLGEEREVVGERESLVLPDPADVEELEVQVIRVGRTEWQLEMESGERTVFDQEVVEAGGRQWRLCLPSDVEPTLDESDPELLLLDDVIVCLVHHEDRRFVRLDVEWPDGRHSFGERNRYRLLLELAETRLEWENGEGQEPWLYDDWLCEHLGINSNQMNRWTHDLRNDFRSIGVHDGQTIVERRGGWSRNEDTRQRTTAARRLRVIGQK